MTRVENKAAALAVWNPLLKFSVNIQGQSYSTQALVNFNQDSSNF